MVLDDEEKKNYDTNSNNEFKEYREDVLNYQAKLALETLDMQYGLNDSRTNFQATSVPFA